MLLCSLFVLAPCCGSLVRMHKFLSADSVGHSYLLRNSKGAARSRSETPCLNEERRRNPSGHFTSYKSVAFIFKGSPEAKTHVDGIRASKKGNQISKDGYRKGKGGKNKQIAHNLKTPRVSVNGGNKEKHDRSFKHDNLHKKHGDRKDRMWNIPSFPNTGKETGLNGSKDRNHACDRWITKPMGDKTTVDTNDRPEYERPIVHYDQDFNIQYHSGTDGKNIRSNSKNHLNKIKKKGRTYSDKQYGRSENKANYSSVSYADMDAQISRFNRKLAQETQKIMRSTTEPLNPLLNKVAHSNQKNQKLHLSPEARQKIMLLTKGGIKALQGRNKRLTPTSSSKNSGLDGKGTKPIKLDKNDYSKAQSSHEQGIKGDQQAKGYHNEGGIIGKEKEVNGEDSYNDPINFTANELNMMTVDVPGIRKLNVMRNMSSIGFRSNAKESPSKVETLNDKLTQLRTLGYDGIVDMNTLFDETSKVFQERSNTSTAESNVTTFIDLGIRNSGIINALREKGISTATVTQGKYIPELTRFFEDATENEGKLKCMTVHAPTGSGKTLAYMLPLLQRTLRFEIPLMKDQAQGPFGRDELITYINSLFTENVIVLAPSVELSVQSHMVVKQLYQAYEDAVGRSTHSSEPKEESSPGSVFTNVFRNIGSKILQKIRKSKQGNLKSDEKTEELGHKGESPTSTTDVHAENPLESMRLKIVSDVKPILLIGNANVAHQKKALKELKARQIELRNKAVEIVKRLYDSGSLSNPLEDFVMPELRRLVGFMFTTPGRAYSLWKTHKLLDIEGTKYRIVDEYDGFLNLSRKRKPDTIKEKDEVENPQIKEVLDAMLSNRKRGSLSSLGNAASKYVVCLSASKIKNAPQSFGKLANVPMISEETEYDVESPANYDYDTPKNILHTMCTYSVPDAKLSLLRKILRAFPYEKSVLVFCDSNGTAQFLQTYLTRQFPASDVTVLNCRQGKLERKKSFQSVLKSNLDTALRSFGKAIKGSSVPVRSIVVSTQLNSRGIDFSGFSHVIHYDLPHDVTTYLHRSGRIGRAGNPGICISLVESRYLPVFQRAVCRHLPAEVHNLELFKGYLYRRPVEVSAN